MSKNGFLILFLERIRPFLIWHNRETLLGAWRASWKLLGVLGSSPTSPWVFSSIHDGFPPFGVGEEDGLQIGGIDVKGRHNWSMEQLLRTLGEGLHLLFGLYFFPISLICKT